MLERLQGPSSTVQAMPQKRADFKVRAFAAFCARVRDIALVVRTTLGPPNFDGLHLA